jgi:iron complex transport system permease protein
MSDRLKVSIVLFFVLALIVGGFVWGLLTGTIDLSFSSFTNLTDIERDILFKIRLPRLLAAFIVGAALAVAGASFQGVLQNPLAGPYILGVSSGAGAGVVIASVLLPIVSMALLPLWAFLGAIFTVFIVFGFVRLARSNSISHYILVGIMVNAFFSAVMMLFLFFSGTKIHGIMIWLMGDFSSVQTNILLIAYLITVPVTFVLSMLGYQISILALGDDQAKSIGVKIDRLRTTVFFLASLLTGIAVSLAGIIGFVGLVVPHTLRLVLKDDFRVLLPLSFLLGGGFVVLTDTLSRAIMPDIGMPVGVVTSFVGAPFFLWLFVKQGR